LGFNLSIIAIVVVQLSSKTDTARFYNIMDTIIKVALGAWGGATVSESNKEDKAEKLSLNLHFRLLDEPFFLHHLKLFDV
jgi:hypothetical protein